MQIKFTKEFVEGLAAKLAEVIKEEQGQNLRVKDFEYEGVPVTLRWVTSGYGDLKVTAATVSLDNRLDIFTVPVECGNLNSLTMRTPLVTKITELLQVFINFSKQYGMTSSLRDYLGQVFNPEFTSGELDIPLIDEVILISSVCPDSQLVSLKLFKGEKVLCQFNDIPSPYRNPNNTYSLQPTAYSFDSSMLVGRIYEVILNMVGYQQTLSEGIITIQTERLVTAQEYQHFRNQMDNYSLYGTQHVMGHGSFSTPGMTGFSGY